jgi:uncharacterized protein (DUF1330 family)
VPLARVISGQSRLLGSANLVTRSGHVFQDAAGVPSRHAYVAETDVTDPEQYKAASPAAIAPGGGRFLVRVGELVVLEGGWQLSRLVTVNHGQVTRAPSRESAGQAQARYVLLSRSYCNSAYIFLP